MARRHRHSVSLSGVVVRAVAGGAAATTVVIVSMLHSGSASADPAAGGATVNAYLNPTTVGSSAGQGGSGEVDITQGDTLVLHAGAAPGGCSLNYQVTLGASGLSGKTTIKAGQSVSLAPTAGTYPISWSGQTGPLHLNCGPTKGSGTVVVASPPPPPPPPVTSTSADPSTPTADGSSSAGASSAPSSGGAGGSTTTPAGGTHTTPNATVSNGHTIAVQPIVGTLPNGAQTTIAAGEPVPPGFAGPPPDGGAVSNGVFGISGPSAGSTGGAAVDGLTTTTVDGVTKVIPVRADVTHKATRPIGLAIVTILALAIVSAAWAYQFLARRGSSGTPA